MVTTGRASPRTKPAPSRGQSLGALAVRAVLAAALLFAVVLFAAPLISSLVNDEADAPRLVPFVAPPEEDVRSGNVATPLARRYVVKSGDTLRSIASSVYGDEARWTDIYEANARTIADPDSLVVGTTLTIPDQ
jgi:nucleoid-associated protein YgaU